MRLEQANQKNRSVQQCFRQHLAWCFSMVLTAGVLTAAQPDGNAGLVIARDGDAAMVIALADGATPGEEYAARELALHLNKITGGTFDIVAETELERETGVLFVGPTAFAARHDVDIASMGPEAWCLRGVDGNLILVGGRPRGSLYAVYEFLEEELGVAWIREGVTLLTETPDLRIPEPDRGGAPAFAAERAVHNHLRRVLLREPLTDFHSRNKAAGWWSALGYDSRYGHPMGSSPHRAHTFWSYIPPAEYFDAHPEWFTMNAEGERTNLGAQLCLTNEAMQAEVVRRMRAWIEQDRARARETDTPYPVIYELSQNDFPNAICLCPDCRAVVKREGSESGLLIQFVNAVAEAIEPDYPDVDIITFAYTMTQDAPKTIRPRHNVIVQVAFLGAIRAPGDIAWRDPSRPLTHACHDTHRGRIEAWRSLGARVSIWDYWRLFMGDTFSTPYSSLHVLQPDLQFLHRIGVQDGYFAQREGGRRGEVSFFSLHRWLGLKLMDNPYREDVPAMVERFMHGYYGPAADAMLDWLDFLEQSLADDPMPLTSHPAYSRAYLNRAFFREAYARFDRAEALCVPGSDELIRVWKERMPVDGALLGLWDKLEREANTEGEPWPWQRAEVLERYAQHKNVVLTALYHPNTLPQGLRELEDELRRLREQMDQPPLPEAFRALPSGSVVDILRRPEWERPSHNRHVVEDPEAPGGMAVRLRLPDDDPGDPLPIGLWSHRPSRFGPGITMRRETLPQDERYHWYKLGPWHIEPAQITRLYAHRRWYIALDGLDRPIVLGYPPQDWYVFFALKVEGPAYVDGSTRENAVSVGRILLVKADIPEAENFMP